MPHWPPAPAGTTPATHHVVIVVASTSLETTTTSSAEVATVLVIVVVGAPLVVEFASLTAELLVPNSTVFTAVRIAHRCVPSLEFVFRASARFLCCGLGIRAFHFALGGSRGRW
jgi:hypothetical protein